MNKKISLFLTISFLMLLAIFFPFGAKISTAESCTHNGQEGIVSSTTGECIPMLNLTGDNATSSTPTTTATGNNGLIPCGHGNNPADACTLCHFIVGFKNLISFGLTILITIAVVGIFISGVMYIISSGNEQLLGKAKSFLASSLIGFSIVLTGWLIVNVVMWALSFNTSLTIGKENWYTFTCDSQTAATSATPAATTLNTTP